MEFPGSSAVKNPPAMQEMLVRSLGGEDCLKKEIGNPLQYSCLENSMHKGTLKATVQGFCNRGCKELDMTYQLNNVLYTL